MTATNSPDEFLHYPGHLPIILDNRSCAYCGAELTAANTTKEHVIARRFVPRGKLDGWWNLIVRACESCNRRKQDLEDDISAITMAPDAAGRLATNDPAHQSEAARKGRGSFSRRTGKPVELSAEQVKIEALMMEGAWIKAEFTAPPQIESDRIFQLALFQIRAFFYLVTYDESRKTGKFWHEGFYPLMHVIRSDWGNPVMRAFAEAVRTWEPRFIATGADGFFQIAIRRHPTAGCFSWALEWNRNYRIIGFFGDREMAQEVVKTLPALETHTIAQDGGNYVRYRQDVALKDEDDILFGE